MRAAGRGHPNPPTAVFIITIENTAYSSGKNLVTMNGLLEIRFAKKFLPGDEVRHEKQYRSHGYVRKILRVFLRLDSQVRVQQDEWQLSAQPGRKNFVEVKFHESRGVIQNIHRDRRHERSEKYHLKPILLDLFFVFFYERKLFLLPEALAEQISDEVRLGNSNSDSDHTHQRREIKILEHESRREYHEGGRQ